MSASAGARPNQCPPRARPRRFAVPPPAAMRASVAVLGLAAAAARQRAASTLAAAAAATAPAAARGRIVVESDLPPVEVPKETLPQYLLRRSAHLSEQPCVTCAVSKRSLSYAQVREASRRWALALASQLDLRPGHVVALLLPNMPEYLPAVQGALLAGLSVTMANPLYTAEELRRQFGDAGARVVATVPALAATARAAVGPATPIVLLPPPDAASDAAHAAPPADALHWKALLEAAGAAGAGAAALPEGDPDAVAALPYSSGTTGLPKGVMLTHRNLVANIECMSVPQLRHVQDAEEGQEVILTVLPFFHIYGFNGVLNLAVASGSHSISMPVFTPEAYVRSLIEYKPTLLAVVPSLLQFLAVHPAVTREMLQSVRVVVSGAAPATEALLNKFRLKCGRDDLVVSQGYGMTETAPVTLLVPLAVRREKETSIGRVIPNTRARVLRADGADAAPREHGELLVTGPQLMKGYLNNEKATQETIDEEGWLHTGDVVYYDEENYFYIVDRTKELIKVKGNQVSPTELENLVMELPEVADCAVVGIPDDRHDELPRAFVVLHPNKKLSEEQIKKHIEPRVVKYKRLEGGVIFLDKIPRNPSGKILRQVLKAWKPEQ
ncbi:hypothetical protein R5R35_014119 [Gryllus longicercus]|uniref:Uncharacterized protein n=1 Tax=Gryllus longicercus TaxID=2509291 RepID=A0AAN9V570_9ORTH